MASEVEAGAHFAENLLKDYTGNATLAVRRMYGSTYEIRRSFKIFIAGNHRPQVRSGGTAFASRLKMLPFNGVFTGAKGDPDMPRKLAEASSAALAWMIEGHAMWLSQGNVSDPELIRHLYIEPSIQDIVYDNRWLAAILARASFVADLSLDAC